MLAYVSANKKLVQYIRDNNLKAGDRLPTETELSEILQTGRLSLREAMNALKSEGILHAVQGKGTFVVCDYNHIADTLNVNYSVTEMIEISGYKPSISFFEKNLVKADTHIAKKLHVQEGSDVLMCTRIHLADETPVVLSEDCLAPALVTEFLGIADESISLYSFVEKHCGIKVGFCVTEIEPTLADDRCAGLLNVEAGVPLLKLYVHVSDVYGAPLIYAIEHFRPDKFKFIVTRGR